MGLAVNVGGGTCVFVFVGGGMRVGILVGTNVAVKGKRARLVTVGVAVTKRLGVDVSDGNGVGVGENVLLGARVGEGTKAVTAFSVSAAAVSMLEKAKSTILTG